uniref:Cytochrome b n=1 Tax=Halice sp. JL-2018 TaxID=2528348 RepID=A0A3Q8LYI4_9CRUS|nr:cytochrome b [Halice sp. JL-2018]
MVNNTTTHNPSILSMNHMLMNLPAPINLSFMWNLGFMLFSCLIIQVITGLVLASYYAPSAELSFYSVSLMVEFTEFNWLARSIHANGATLFFFFLYIHMARGIYYHSYGLVYTWMVGVVILILVMATAFMGYVLPYNQMSYWGASVITNLFSEVPYIGKDLVRLIWGSASVSDPTITRFFTFHFMLPFVIMAMTMVHLNYLHLSGSSNPIGVTVKKGLFHLSSSLKDVTLLSVMMLIFMFIFMFLPLLFSDNDNFVMADSLVTPNHIQPEWYFLFAYAILRSIPNKLGGVIALGMSIMVFFSLPYTGTYMSKSKYVFISAKAVFWWFIVIVILLTWAGACPVEDPYIVMSQMLTFVYFLYFVLNPLFFPKW